MLSLEITKQTLFSSFVIFS